MMRFKWQIILAAILIGGCSSFRLEKDGQEFSFVINYSQYDHTFAFNSEDSVIIRDDGTELKRVIPLKLSKDARDYVSAQIDQIDFVNLPDTVVLGTTDPRSFGEVMYSGFHFRFQRSGVTRSIYWDGKFQSPEASTRKITNLLVYIKGWIEGTLRSRSFEAAFVDSFSLDYSLTALDQDKHRILVSCIVNTKIDGTDAEIVLSKLNYPLLAQADTPQKVIRLSATDTDDNSLSVERIAGGGGG